MTPRYLLALPLLALATPLAAQDHDHSAQANPPEATPPVTEDGHSQMDHDAMGHSRMDHSAMQAGGEMDHTALGHTEPAPITNAGPAARALEGPAHAADTVWGAEAMEPARQAAAREIGGMKTGSLMVERFEARLGREDAYLWDLQAFWGGDIDKFAIKSEGEGSFDGGGVDDAEIQALWSHAIGPFFDLQAGARVDVEPDTRSHLVLGVQGLAPYMWHVDAAAFLSDRGDLTARIEAEYDQKLTQRLILQPRAEFNLAAQDIAERGIGAGLSSFEAGLRLRYEIVREFAPYVGVEWEQKLGETRRIARADGERASSVAVLLGIRAWY